jgi:hypothetical protein
LPPKRRLTCGDSRCKEDELHEEDWRVVVTYTLDRGVARDEYAMSRSSRKIADGRI